MENYNNKIKKTCEELMCYSCPLRNKKLCPSNNFEIKTDVSILEQLLELKQEIEGILKENELANSTRSQE